MSDSMVQEPGYAGKETAATRTLGFWAYIMSDCVLFGTLFVAYAVLSRNYAGGPAGKEIFDLREILIETFLLLSSSFTYGLATVSAEKGKRAWSVGLLIVTFALGAVFVAREIHEFSRLIAAGHGPGESAFLSAFFTLVGTHGLHVSAGLLWMAVLAVQLVFKGITAATGTRVKTLALYWHFLDIVWICIFTFVYLMG